MLLIINLWGTKRYVHLPPDYPCGISSTTFIAVDSALFYETWCASLRYVDGLQ